LQEKCGARLEGRGFGRITVFGSKPDRFSSILNHFLKQTGRSSIWAIRNKVR